MYSCIKESIVLSEPEGIIDFRKEDLYRYSGPRSMIASALVFRLMQEAIRDLCPDEVPERKKFRIVSGHSGPGVRDGFEYLTRAVSDKRYKFDPSNPPPEALPSAAKGYMFFIIQYKDKGMLYVLSSEIFGKEWFNAVRAYQEGSETEEAHAAYLIFKNDLCGKILHLPNIFTRREPLSSMNKI